MDYFKLIFDLIVVGFLCYTTYYLVRINNSVAYVDIISEVREVGIDHVEIFSILAKLNVPKEMYHELVQQDLRNMRDYFNRIEKILDRTVKYTLAQYCCTSVYFDLYYLPGMVLASWIGYLIWHRSVRRKSTVDISMKFADLTVLHQEMLLKMAWVTRYSDIPKETYQDLTQRAEKQYERLMNYQETLVSAQWRNTTDGLILPILVVLLITSVSLIGA